MRRKIIVLVLAIVFITVGCSDKPIEKPTDNETISNDHQKEDNNVEENTENEEPEKAQEEEKVYMGQALDTLDRDGIVEVYEEKSMSSKVIHKLKDLDKVELTETLPYGWFKVLLDDGTEGYVDARYVRTKEVPPHEYDENVEGYALVFNHQDQKLKIYKDGQLEKEAIASSGLWDHFTPRGVFQIESDRRGKAFYTPRHEQGGKYWVGFKGVYLFHSIPTDEKGNFIDEEAEKLGQPASHGCIRLPVDVAKYIYDNVPEKSRVIIY